MPGDFSAFSAEVYAKGAYAKYAAFLGLNTKQAQRAMLRALSTARETIPLRIHTPQRWQRRTVRTLNFGVRFALSIQAVFAMCPRLPRQ
jgi:hypothetical protein